MSSHPKIPKTNAARLLEKLAIAYSLHSAPVDEEDLSAVTMAHNLGVPPQCVFKTLVARGDKTGVLIKSVTERKADGKNLVVDISTQAIQSTPDDAVTEAWGCTVKDGVLVPPHGGA